MNNLLQWWIGQIPDPAITFTVWEGFRKEMLAWALITSALVGVGIVVIYAVRSRKLQIRKPSDPFRPYTPLGWLALSLLSGVVVLIAYFVLYYAMFDALGKVASVSPMGGALQAALLAIFLTLFLAQLAIWFIPGATPAKYKYHPRWYSRLLPR